MVTRVMRALRAGLTMLLTAAVVVTIVQVTPSRGADAPDRGDTRGRSEHSQLTDLGALQLAAAPAACPKIDVSDATANVSNSCIALHSMAARRQLFSRCLTDKAPKSAPPYLPQQCALGRGLQVEAVAQARAINFFNRNAVMGSTSVNGISPDIQWELTYRSPAGVLGRADILLYDHTVGADPNNPARDPGPPDIVNIIEVKVKGSGNTIDRAGVQAQRYVNAFPGPARLYDFPNGYDDSFSVLDPEHPCSDGTQRVRDYKVTAPQDGVLWVEEQESNCKKRTTPVPTSTETAQPTSVPVPTNETGDPVYLVPIGRDDNHNGVDDFWDFIRNHPELDDLFQLPKELPSLISQHPGTVLMTGGAILALGQVLLANVPRIAALTAGEFALAASAPIGLIVTVAVLIGILLGLPFLWNLWGDPHLVTLDKLHYDLQSVGEFHLLEIPEYGIDIQTRLVPLNSDVSAGDRIAFMIDDSLIELRSNNAVLIDGETVTLDSGSVRDLGADASIMRSGNRLMVVFPGVYERTILVWDHGTIAVTGGSDTTRGLLGNNDGNPNNDLALRDGSRLAANVSRAVLYGSYAESWRISDDDSLFTYGPGESTETFTNRSFPANVLTLGDFTNAEVNAATAICTTNEVPPGPQFNDCVYDMAVTGDDKYAAAAANVTDVLVDPHAADLNATGSLSQDFEAGVPTNLDAHRYRTDPATSRVAGPLLSTSGYQFYLDDVRRHDSVSLSIDLLAYGGTDTDDVAQSAQFVVQGGPTVSVQLDGADPQVTPAGLGQVSRTRTETTAAGEAFTVFHLDLVIPHWTPTLAVTLNPKNFVGILGTSLAVDNLQLSITTPPLQSFSVALPQTIGADQPVAGAGRLESAGAQDDYIIDVTGVGANLVAIPSSCSTIRVVLVRDSDAHELTPALDSCALLRYDDVPAGRYRFEVHNQSGRAITYGLPLSTVTDPAESELVVDGPAVSTTFGAGQRRAFTFTGVVGQRLRFSVPDLTVRPRLTLTAPDGTKLLDGVSAAAGNVWVLEPGQAGTHRVFLDPEGAATGSTTVQVQTVEDLANAEIAVDGPAVVSTFAAGQNRALTFTAVAGQQLKVSVPSTSLGTLLTLTAPDGTNVLNGVSISTDSFWVLAPVQAGTYQVFLNPSGASTGSTSLQVQAVAEDPSIAVVVAADTFTRTVASGLGTAETGGAWTLGGSVPSASVVDGSGRLAPAAARTNTYKLDSAAAINTDLVHTIWLEQAPNGGGATLWTTVRSTATGDYRVRLGINSAGTMKASLAKVVGTETALTTAVTVPGGSYSANQKLRIRIQAVGSAPTTLRVKIWPATGTEPVAWLASTTDNTPALQRPGSIGLASNLLGSSGQIIRIDDLVATTGQAQTVEDLPDAAIAVDGPAVVSTFGIGQNRTLTFTGVPGQRLKLSVPNTSPATALTLTASDGTKVLNAVTTAAGNLWVLDPVQAGTYRVYLDPEGASTGSTSVQVQTVGADLPTAEIAVDGPVVSSTFAPGQNRTLTFTGVAGQRLKLSVPSNSLGTSLTLTAPNGTTLLNALPISAGNAWVLEPVQAGAYQVFLNPDGAGTGSTSLQLQTIEDLPTAQITVDGPAVSSTFAAGQNRTLTFTGVVGQRLKLSAPSTSLVTSLTLTAPDGTTLLNGVSVSTGNEWVLTSVQAGTYQVFLNPDGAGTGSTSIQVQTVPDDVPAGVVVASDTFTRTVASGLGTAETGGAWTLGGSAPSASVVDGSGRLAPAAARTNTYKLNSVVTLNTDLIHTIWLEQNPSGGGATLWTIGRSTSTGDYRVKLNINSAGTMTAQLVKVVGSSETALTTSVTIPGGTYTVNQRLRIRIQTFGTSPTTVRAKIWQATGTEPTAWLANVTDNTVGLQQAGAIGLVSNRLGTAPTWIIRIDDLVATERSDLLTNP